MKKIGKRFAMLAILMLTDYDRLAGLAAQTGFAAQMGFATQTEGADYANVFEIREKMFIEQCNDIYLNPDDYMDRMVKLEGIYEEEKEGNATSRYVIRYGPGCCGNDGVAGFEVIADEISPMPRQGDWVEAVGSILRLKDPDDLEYIVLKLSRLEVKEERGAEFVSN
jgi:uncharacterized membrane protein YcgQ (UPF0703/DUF1980 family)